MACQKLLTLMGGLTLILLLVVACGGVRVLGVPIPPTAAPELVTVTSTPDPHPGRQWRKSEDIPPAKRGNCICEEEENENEHNAPTDCTSEAPPECQVKSIEVIGEGAYPKWSHAKNLIAFNRAVNGNYEIFTVKPDGSDATCLTCDKEALPPGHKGQPYWHPSGEYIVFTAENTASERMGWDLTVMPGIGRNHNVWMMTSDGSQHWQITNYPENWGVIRPSFSHDGKTLYWNEEYSFEKYPGVGLPWSLDKNPRGEEWGLWRIKLADVSFESDGPEVANIRNVVHSDLVLLEGSGFGPDDRRLIFTSASLTETEGTAYWGGDIYTSDLGGGSLTRLTNTPYYHDENVEYSPDGKKIVWSHACGGAPAKEVELYLMDSDGSNKARLTHFNEPGYPEYLSKTYGSGEIDWSPDGTRIVFGYGYRWRFKYPFVAYRLHMLTFEGACGNLP
jgi:Tol biopolymer transport system component